MENLTDKQIEQELSKILDKLNELQIKNKEVLKEMEKNLTKEQIEQSKVNLNNLKKSFKSYK